MREDDRTAAAPVLEINLRTVLRGDRVHRMGSLMGGSGVFGGGSGGGGRQRGGCNGGRAGKQHVAAACRRDGVEVCGTHWGSLNVRWNDVVWNRWSGSARTLAGSRRAFAVAGRQAHEGSERTSTGA
ncbi:hypothetical protein F3J14_08170 [Burkholderia sp. Tr-862]|nr:hypothetical protein [Burkholderia sp. Tr-862]